MNSPSPELPELLASIRSHADLMKIPEPELPRLAGRNPEYPHSLPFLTGGHLGPNLGVVELSIALHRVFETPRDKIIFDVSHQAYVHKMLTGRAPLIHTIRQHGRAFRICQNVRILMTPTERACGHGAFRRPGHVRAARDLKGKTTIRVAAAGDAAFTCGTTLEALNNISQTTKRYITILNDKRMGHRQKRRSAGKILTPANIETFSWLRDKTASFIEKLAARRPGDFAFKLEGTTKNLIFPSLLFNKFGLRWLGPWTDTTFPP